MAPNSSKPLRPEDHSCVSQSTDSTILASLEEAGNVAITANAVWTRCFASQDVVDCSRRKAILGSVYGAPLALPFAEIWTDMGMPRYWIVRKPLILTLALACRVDVLLS
eukprot:TRINITY_DN101311_c0_g1_i1.p1 TRINITY_DN101311_c0_g1~~TRINITY_DN101311_c0_g1_i1.p1  ORF type:complete len:109 (-),score=6.71 TRINITY_DN101311_c0_g1_i1:127-453(-)